jgi:hypothetical protein
VTTLVACALLTLGLALYIFFPEKKVTAQREKPRLEFLEERKAMLYDNLRDLHFEHRAGKYTEGEFAVERAAIELEAATVVAEMEQIGRSEQAGHSAGIRGLPSAAAMGPHADGRSGASGTTTLKA